MAKKVIDISKFNNITDFAKEKASVDAVVIRLGYRGAHTGVITYDPKYQAYMAACQKLGIPTMIYFFPCSITVKEAHAEAKFIISEASKVSLCGPIWLDSEVVFSDRSGRSDELSREARTLYLNTILADLKAAGYQCGVYASTSWFKNYLIDNDLVTYCRRWVADWSTKCSYTAHPYEMWQYTSKGSVPGIKGDVDMSCWYAAEEKGGATVSAQDVIGVMRGWIGKSRSAGTHHDIIDLYNSYIPRARGYKVKYSDEYCDTALSAAFIKLGAVDLIGGTECGVERHVDLFKAAGIWQENGRKTPSPGWIIVYNWDDSTQPNDGFSDHIGIVENVSGGKITCIEGNMSGGVVGRRTIPIGWGYIRGYAIPKYKTVSASNASAVSGKKTVVDIAKEVLAGRWGSGEARVMRLKAAGYDYSSVQKKVNELLGGTTLKPVEDIAREVIAGRWGNGEARKEMLSAAGYDYAAVQEKVNAILKGGLTSYRVCLEESHKAATIREAGRYDVLAVDACYTAEDVEQIHAAGCRTAFCYVNYGMAEKSWKDFRKYKSITIGHNSDWPDEYWIDVAASIWKERIRAEVLAAKRKGFDGIWLDNGDIYWYALEKKKDSLLAKKIYSAMVEMCQWIKGQKMLLIMNGADTFVSKLMDEKRKAVIDGVNQETVFTSIRSYSGDGKFGMQTSAESDYFKTYCIRCKENGLRVFLLEYAGDESMEDTVRSFCIKNRLDGYYISRSIKL